MRPITVNAMSISLVVHHTGRVRRPLHIYKFRADNDFLFITDQSANSHFALRLSIDKGSAKNSVDPEPW